jgi:tRNA U54 and U55 pseudouridine synthase Pus10
MLGMDVGDAALAGYLTLMGGVLGALLWTRLNRIEAELATKAGKTELEAVRQELARKAGKADVEAIRREMAIMRSDLTQVALAVGARRSQASEG